MLFLSAMGKTTITSAELLRQRLLSEKGFITVPTADEATTVVVVQRSSVVFIDCEHDTVSLKTASTLASHAHKLGGSAIIRTKSAQPSDIPDYLACHPDGLVIPNVESREAGNAVYEAMRQTTDSAAQPLLIVQIESVTGVKKTTEIGTAQGVDAVLIGPNDLAASMGFAGQPQHPAVIEAVHQVAGRLSELRVPFGLPVTPNTIDAWRQKGARLFFMMPQQFNRS